MPPSYRFSTCSSGWKSQEGMSKLDTPIVGLGLWTAERIRLPAVSLRPEIGPCPSTSAYHVARVDRFLAADPYYVLGALAAAHTHDLE